MAEFFAYEHVKMLLVYCVFFSMVGVAILSYGFWIVSGVKWIVKKVRDRFRKDRSEEESENE